MVNTELKSYKNCWTIQLVVNTFATFYQQWTPTGLFLTLNVYVR